MRELLKYRDFSEEELLEFLEKDSREDTVKRVLSTQIVCRESMILKNYAGTINTSRILNLRGDAFRERTIDVLKSKGVEFTENNDCIVAYFDLDTLHVCQQYYKTAVSDLLIIKVGTLQKYRGYLIRQLVQDVFTVKIPTDIIKQVDIFRIEYGETIGIVEIIEVTIHNGLSFIKNNKEKAKRLWRR